MIPPLSPIAATSISTTTRSSKGTSSSDHNRLLDVAWFALLSLAITLAAGVPVLLSTQAGPVGGALPPPRPITLSTPLAQLLIGVGAAGPALAAVIVVAVRAGRAGAGSLLAQLRRWDTNPLWYLLGLVGPTAVALVAVALSGAMGRPSAGTALAPPSLVTVLVLTLYGLGQEVGWRGFAFPLLEARVGALVAALVTGTIWFAWSEWRLISPGGRFLIQPFGLLLLLLLYLAASVVIGWMYNSSGRRLPVAWVANVGLLIMFATVAMQFFQFALLVGLFLVAAAVVLVTQQPDPRSAS